MAALSRRERLGEAACLRLKNAAYCVAGIVEALVEGVQKVKMYEEAVMLGRLLVHRDQAYTRLAINLQHLSKPGQRQLEAVREVFEDDAVKGGERVGLFKRLAALQRKFGDSQDSPCKKQPSHAPE